MAKAPAITRPPQTLQTKKARHCSPPAAPESLLHWFKVARAAKKKVPAATRHTRPTMIDAMMTNLWRTASLSSLEASAPISSRLASLKARDNRTDLISAKDECSLPSASSPAAASCERLSTSEPSMPAKYSWQCSGKPNDTDLRSSELWPGTLRKYFTKVSVCALSAAVLSNKRHFSCVSLFTYDIRMEGRLITKSTSSLCNFAGTE
mmetsp:Transcript_48943/g.116386  ORF Transcript_48943/g.116386 Transcript_48943/m.116386 type:complete len:207 (+) Transcript_48943:228-848(+)